MKNNRIFKCLLLFSICSMLCLLQSCDKNDDLKSEINSLKDRVKLLEEAAVTLNTSIDSYRKLLSGSVVVGVTPIDRGYRVELSDGSTVDIVGGDKIDALIPEITIDKDGYWAYRTDKTAAFKPMTDKDGNKIVALPHNEEGTAIKSPKLRVDKDGFWEVSYDNGTTYVPLLNGNDKIPATGDNAASSTSIFESVVYNPTTSELEIVLVAGNQKVSFPVVNSFYLNVLGTSEPQKFPLGETRYYEVEQSDVAQAIVQAPEGWQVKLEEKLLTIISPTKNAVEKEETINIVITSSKKYIRIVPIKVILLTTGYDANACDAWNKFNTEAADNVLLDFSYAGYKRGEVAPPADIYSLGYKIYNVKAYGATGDGVTSDREAVKKIIAEIGTGKANANAIIYFPAGSYVLHSSADNVDSKSETLLFVMGNVILKGDGRSKTKIIMQDPNLPENPENMWSSPTMINIKHNGGAGLAKFASVTEDAPKGAFTVTVDDVTKIKANNWVCLKLINNTQAAINEELGGKTSQANWTDLNTTGVQVYDYHQVKSVSGKKVTFYEPIMHAVKEAYKWEICDYPHYENAGVEDMTFVGNAKKGFVHHGSWEDDSAYKPISFMRMTNSWMRRVDFVSVSEAFSIASSANVSAYDVEISGNRGHSAIRAQASSRVFIGKVNDRSSSDVAGAGQFHACGVSEQSIGSVIWNVTWGTDGCFESHAKQPRATLIDQCEGALITDRAGGDIPQLPNHLDDLTIWNLNATFVKPGTSIFTWWESGANAYNKIMPPTIVGLHGAASAFTFAADQVKYTEKTGSPVSPYSLYEAQLRKRLGYVPAWLNSLK